MPDKGSRSVVTGPVDNKRYQTRMFRSRLIITKLVWLTALLMPLQGLPGAPCCCAEKTTVVSEALGCTQPETQRCCCGRGAVRSTSPSTAAKSCCGTRNADHEPRQCRCWISCQCQQDGSSPQQDQLPPPCKLQTVDQSVQPLTGFDPDDAYSEPNGAQDRAIASTSASDRCVLLCRFHL